MSTRKDSVNLQRVRAILTVNHGAVLAGGSFDWTHSTEAVGLRLRAVGQPAVMR